MPLAKVSRRLFKVWPDGHNIYFHYYLSSVGDMRGEFFNQSNSCTLMSETQTTDLCCEDKGLKVYTNISH